MWSAAELEPLAVEAIHGLVRDLNETTRFSTLATPALDNGLGVQTVCGWMTGFPLRTGFVRGRPDPRSLALRFCAAHRLRRGRLRDLGVVDRGRGGRSAALSQSLCAAPALRRTRDVHFEVARPGVDGDAILYDARVGALVAQKSSGGSVRADRRRHAGGDPRAAGGAAMLTRIAGGRVIDPANAPRRDRRSLASGRTYRRGAGRRTR